MTSNFSAVLELLDTDLHHIISFLARFDDLENQPQVHRGQNFMAWRKMAQAARALFLDSQCSGGVPLSGMSKSGSYHQLFDFSPTLTITAFGLFRYQQFLSRSATTE